MKKIAKIFAALLALMLVVSVAAIPAMAVTVTGVDGVEVTVDSNGSISESSGTVTVTAKGSLMSKKTATITVTNTSGATATISFNYSVSKASSYSFPAASGTYTETMAADATTSFTITSNSGWSNLTVTATLSNFSVVAAAASADVTVGYNSALGSVTVDGVAAASGSVHNVDSSTGAAVVATPVSGATFLGWINAADNSVLSTSTSYTVIPANDMTVRAVFASKTTDACFWANNKTHLFEDLNAAATYAAGISDKVIVLAENGTLPAGNYTIPAGVTLLIPYDAANTLCTTKPSYEDDAYTAPTVYRTLIMANGANITVNGAISLSAKLSSKYAYNGMPSGALPFINMNTGSNITVNNGGALYAWGYITGSGSVTVNSGGIVYENFQIADYRGGDVTTQMVNNADTYGVFPFNQYYIQNIEVPMTLYAGAKENGHTAVTVTLAGTQDSDVPFMGVESSEGTNPMFIIQSGYVVKDYVEGTGRLSVKICGDVKVSTITMSMKVSLVGSITIDSAKYALPINHNMTVEVESGTITLDQSIAFLPGSELYIREGAKCILGTEQSIYVYDYDQWIYNSGANGYSGTNNLRYIALSYVPGGNGTTGRTKDALIQVDGEIDASAGYAYVTEGGANIYSTGTGQITLTPGTKTVTYQVTTNSTDISGWPEIALIAPVLRDEDGATVSASEVDDEKTTGTYTYYASTGKWCKPGHRYGDGVVTAPTCTAAGYTTHTCIACGYSYNDTEVAALGHTEVVDAAVAATCTATGLTEGKHCSVCGEVTVAQNEVAALGHTEVVDAGKAATCTTTGLTEGKHCSVCGEVTVAQEEIPALGHSYGDWVTVVAPTYKQTGTKTCTCSVCGAVETAVIDALANPVSGWNLILRDNIGVNFEMTLADADVVTATVNGIAAVVVKNGNTVSIEVAAAQMTDVIAISVNGLPLANTYSVREYADVILAGDYSDTAKNLVKAMLVYGGASQKYFGHNTGNLASNETATAVPESATDIALSDSIDGLDFYGASLSYRNKIAVRFYFTAALTGYTVDAGDYTYTIGENYVEIAGILPQDLGNQITVTVTDAENNTVSVSYGPMNYIVRMYNKADAKAEAKALVQALYGYYLAAEAYTA